MLQHDQLISEESIESTALGAQRGMLEVADSGYGIMEIRADRRLFPGIWRGEGDFYANPDGAFELVLAPKDLVARHEVPIMADGMAVRSGGLHRQLAKIGSGVESQRIEAARAFAGRYGLLRGHRLWDAEKLGLHHDYYFDLLSHWLELSAKIAAFVKLFDLVRRPRVEKDGLERMFYASPGRENEWFVSLEWDGRELSEVGGRDQLFETSPLFRWGSVGLHDVLFLDGRWHHRLSNRSLPLVTKRYAIARYFLSEQISQGLERNITVTLDPLRSQHNAQTIAPLNLEGAIWLYFANEFTTTNMSGRWCARPGCDNPLAANSRPNKKWCSDSCRQWSYDEKARANVTS